jgi:signal transduction histidine kinase/DNA-binding response OmpR family regulator
VSSSPLRVLHLEDDPGDAELVASVLEDGGILCDIRRVHTREGFTAALDEGGWDLVLADFSLPSFDGMSALHIVLERRPELPFVFVSGALGEEVAIEAVKIGATDYVLKQRLSRLVSAVTRALRERQARTQQRQAEQRLRRSEAFLAEGQRISHTGSWGWQIDTGEIVWSDEQFRVLGLEPGSVEPSIEGFLTMVHPDDVERVRRTVEEVQRHRGPFTLDCRILAPGGATRHLRSVARPVPSESTGGVEEFIGTTSDITERVEAEAALRTRQEMLDIAQKAARVVAFEWQVNGHGLQHRWTRELSALHGLPAQADPTFAEWKELVHPEDRATVEQAIGQLRRQGDMVFEYRVVHPRGTTHWLQLRARLLADDAAGGPGRIVGFVLDVTDRHEAEAHVRQLESRLRQAQRLEALGTLAGGIAHDFNNILGAILGYGERAQRNLPVGSRVRYDVECILTAGERGRALVERVLTFSRSGVGERIAVRVEPVVRAALELVTSGLPISIGFSQSLAAGEAAMLGDPTQVHQVVTNLVTNAIHAMPAGGTLAVSLSVRQLAAERVATVGRIAPGHYIVLEVGDTGTGIAPDVLERIFDPFFTTKEVGTGTGLGLSLVHGIVMDVGGAVDVDTAAGAGSTFTVYLPCTQEQPDVQPVAAEALPQGRGQRVMFVDDEAALVDLGTDTLAEVGFAPVGFTSSLAALEAFEADPDAFDIVVTDERMPGMAGSVLIRRIRALRPTMPILLVTGFVGSLPTMQGGPDEVLKKPVSASALAHSVARLVGALS